ncbi:MAG: AmmeMemoRadiSam system protein A [Candidatus Polarisedimenticolia bacterium]
MPSDLRPLEIAERTALLRLARAAIAARIRGQGRPPLPEGPSRLLVPQAAFVTLRLSGELRGCIGTIFGDRPLAEAVVDGAAAAAMEDPRFPPLSPSEFGGVLIEISALGLLVPVVDPASIVIGRHGVMVRRGDRRGLLLPQVAIEEGWDVPTYLEHVCLKAGLPPRAWEHGGDLVIFEAEVFAETAPAPQ